MKSPSPVVLSLLFALAGASLGAIAHAQTYASQTAVTDPPPPKKTSMTSDREWAWIGMEAAAAATWSMKIGRSLHPKIARLFRRAARAIHAGLKLTPDQEKLWPTAETAARDIAKTMRDQIEKRRALGRPADGNRGPSAHIGFCYRAGRSDQEIHGRRRAALCLSDPRSEIPAGRPCRLWLARAHGDVAARSASAR